jgi:lysophospholipase L1-like esterase
MLYFAKLAKYCRPVLLASIAINAVLIALFVVLEQRIDMLNRIPGALGIDVNWMGPRLQENLDYMPVDGNTIKVHGIPGFDYRHPVYNRLAFYEHDIRQELRELSDKTSGARLRFKTDSRTLHILAKNVHPSGFSYPELSEAASAGLDIFIEGKYVKTITPRSINEAIDIGPLKPRYGLATVEIYLPIFSRCRIQRIGFDKGSRVEPPDEYRQRVAFYGTSITQGSAAPRPSLTYPAILARMLNVDFYNFGFSGNAKGDLAVADALGEIRADLYVLKYSRQALNTGGVDKNLIRFCNRIRHHHPDARLLIVSSIFDSSEHLGNRDLAARRLAFLAGFQELRKLAPGVYFVDGLTLLGPENENGLADGTHPNALGMNRIAVRLAPIMQSILRNNPPGDARSD